MTQFLHLQRKAREIGCSLVRNPMGGKMVHIFPKTSGPLEEAPPYYLTLRNRRTVAVWNLKDVAKALKREYDDWYWEKNIKNYRRK